MNRARLAGLLVGSAAMSVASVCTAHGTAAPPGVEITSPSQLRTRGPILEVGSDRRIVGAVVGWSRAGGCDHVLAWKAGSTSVFRFSGFGTSYQCGDPVSFRALQVSGTIVSWREAVQGNYCHAFDARADLARGARRTVDHDEEEFEGDCDDSVFRMIGPARQRARGVDMRFGTRSITLRRAADGRTRTIRVPTRVTDAELDAEGLFYAYNVRARWQGHLVFVPFSRFFR